MNVIFLGSTGVHQTLLAAGMFIDPKFNVSCHKLSYFNDYHMEAGGRPIYVGRDCAGRRVHCLGVGEDVKMVNKTINQLRIILDSSAEELQIIPIIIKAQRQICWLHKLARSNWLKPLSSYLIARLLKREYENIRQQIPRLSDYQ